MIRVSYSKRNTYQCARGVMSASCSVRTKESLSLTNHVGKDSVSANRRRGMARLDQWETGEDPADTIRPRQWKGRGMREGG